MVSIRDLVFESHDKEFAVTSESILVTGASGALGRLVTRSLIERGSAGVIAGSRSTETVADAVGKAIPVRHVDFDDPAGLRSAFVRVDTVLIISTDELANPGRRKRQHRNALEAAIAAGVLRVAYTSMPQPELSPSVPFAPDHADMEAAITRSGLDHTILRNGWYQENLLGYLPQIVASGTWFTAAGDGRIPFVSRADTAEATAIVLDETHGSGVLDIAGPEYQTIEEIAAAVEEVVDRRIAVEHVSPDRLATELARQGVPAWMVPMVVATDANQHDGAFEVGPGALARLLGRTPTTVSEFLVRHADRLLAPIHL